jgi:hypothetical protein
MNFSETQIGNPHHLADERRKEQSFVTVIEICVGSCYGTYLAD